MSIARSWATPLTAGAFLLSACTGVLIFFRLDSGLNKAAHEWLSWALLAGVILHGVANFAALKRHFASRLGLGLMAFFAIVLALSFFAPNTKREPPSMASVRALSETPISTLAIIARKSPENIQALLRDEGLAATSETQTIGQLVGPNPRQRARLLEKLLGGKAD